MFRNLCEWLEHRTGYRKLVDAMLLEHVPGGAKWRYVFGSCLAFTFGIQMLTGVLLMLHYSPGDTTAWGSVYFIQYEMDFGWLIRGLHHFGSQTMVVLLALHMLQVVVAGAQLPPREFNWWIGMGLLGIILGLSLTGYLLPWDQKGFYATQVATNIASSIPVVGPFIQRVVVGGPEYGNHTLTQFFTLHVGILPPLAIVLIVAHLYVFRRHGITAPANSKGFEYFWPGQAFKDLVACMIVFAVMACLVIFGGHGVKQEDIDRSGFSVYEDWAKAGQKGFGANLDAPADRQTADYPARPEWYFLFLFQLLKYFTGDLFLVGTVHIPNAVLLLLLVLPLLGYGRMRKFGHVFGIVVVVALLGAVAGLTFLAIVDDSVEPVLGFKAGDKVLGIGPKDEKAADEARHKAEKFQHDREAAEKEAHRAIQLAHQGIPQEGAVLLLRNDPLTQGPRLFQTNCAGCHAHDKEPLDLFDPKKEKAKKTASDLTGFGTYEWIHGLLKNPASPKYFGLATKELPNPQNPKGRKVKVLNRMIEWREGIEEIRQGYDPKEAAKLIKEEDEDLALIARFVAEQAKPAKERDTKLVAKDSKARKLFNDKNSIFRCAECHRLEGEGARTGPELTDWGSPEWIRSMLMSPSQESRHGSRNQMPAFRPMDGPAAEVPLLEFKERLLEFKERFPNIEKTPGLINLPDIDREILIRWMVNDNRVVFGGQVISGAKK